MCFCLKTYLLIWNINSTDISHCPVSMYIQGWCITDKEIVYIGYHASWIKLSCIGTKLNAHFYKWYESLRTFPCKGIRGLDQMAEKLKRDYFQVLPLTCCLQRTLILRERLALVFLLVHSITAWQQSCGSGEALCGTGFEAPVVAPGGHNSPPRATRRRRRESYSLQGPAAASTRGPGPLPTPLDVWLTRVSDASTTHKNAFSHFFSVSL